MLQQVEFLFDNDLITEVQTLIRNSRNHLLLVSPFIDLDARTVDALNEKKDLPDFELFVLFGKNENNYYKSIKKDSLEYLKQFPNVEIRYNERLHAKYYQNDSHYIMTSLNLYDYSLANNIEVGVKGIHGSKGMVGKALDATADLFNQGIDKVKHDVLGVEKGVGRPLEKFQTIFKHSELKYKTQPVFAEKKGLQALIGKKKLQGFEVVVNEFNPSGSTLTETAQPSEFIKRTITTTTQTVVTEVHRISASQIAKNLGLHTKEISIFMEQQGFIKNDQITEIGRSKGLILKKYMGTEYIAYPENLEEIKKLSK